MLIAMNFNSALFLLNFKPFCFVFGSVQWLAAAANTLHNPIPLVLGQVPGEDEPLCVQESWLLVLICSNTQWAGFLGCKMWPLYWHYALTFSGFCALPCWLCSALLM